MIEPYFTPRLKCCPLEVAPIVVEVFLDFHFLAQLNRIEFIEVHHSSKEFGECFSIIKSSTQVLIVPDDFKKAAHKV